MYVFFVECIRHEYVFLCGVWNFYACLLYLRDVYVLCTEYEFGLPIFCYPLIDQK